MSSFRLSFILLMLNEPRLSFRLSFIFLILTESFAPSSSFLSLYGVKYVTAASIAHNHIKIFMIFIDSLETGFTSSPG